MKKPLHILLTPSILQTPLFPNNIGSEVIFKTFSLQFLQRGMVLIGLKLNHLACAPEVWLVRILQIPLTPSNFPHHPPIIRILIRSSKRVLQETLSLLRRLILNLLCLIFLKRPLSQLLLKFIYLPQSVTFHPHPPLKLYHPLL